MTTTTHQVGDARIDVVDIGDITLPLAPAMRPPADGTGRDVVNAALASHTVMPMQDVAVRVGGSVILVDAGAYEIDDDSPYHLLGYAPPPPLLGQLESVGIAPADVRHVVITHRHFDHFSGTTIGSGPDAVPAFPRATYYLGAADWPAVEARICRRCLARGAHPRRVAAIGSPPVGAVSMKRSAVVTAACLAMLACATGPDGQPDAKALRCTQEFGDPAQSKYLLPFPAGRSYTMFQGNCPSNPAWGHNGWLACDFDLGIGDTVVASRAGTVSCMEQRWPDSDRVCGHENGVWITHDDGTVMAYVHFTPNGARVRVGDRVTAGQLIGISGDSGCSSGPHLHVNLLRNGARWEKENTLPLNYRNADGPLTEKHGLVQDAKYTARPTVPVGAWPRFPEITAAVE